MITLKEAITGSVARFDHAVAGVLYYELHTPDLGVYQFSIDMNVKEDVGTSTFLAEYKGITLMRYIRKCMDNETFVKIK